MKKIVLSMVLALGMASVAMANDCDKYKDAKGYKPSYCEDANQSKEPVKEKAYKPFNEEEKVVAFNCADYQQKVQPCNCEKLKK